MSKQPLVLMIIDGWGERTAEKDNAITLADPKNFYRLQEDYPDTLLKSSGIDVGLPEGQMGNSEVGHLNIGAGRVVYQDITRISKSIKNRTFFDNVEINKAISNVQNTNGALHLMGLLSDGGVHSHITHLYALLELCKRKGLEKVYMHCFLDGRDVGPKTAITYLEMLAHKINELGIGKIATVAGRFYPMDRDQRWERVEKGYNAMVLGEGLKAANAHAAVQDSYEKDITDEFVEPHVIIDENGQPIATINDGDSIIFYNFRADRARQISRALVEQDFNNFTRKKFPQVYYVCMTQYDITIPAPVAYKPQNLNNTLGEVLAENQFKQLRIAETEKYAHVTFFFNGGVERENEGEERILIPSPEVETYNLKPEMSAYELTDKIIEQIDKDIFDVIVVNYANPDMVGHTGVLDAAVEAIEVVDECIDKVVNKVLDKSGQVLLTSDHGNCEVMLCPETGSPFTAHTTQKVPFVLVSNKYKKNRLLEEGALEDIAPTMLYMLGVDIPDEMTGKCLIAND
ncbi:2,3-bisphosphoglycerate-independent phosphoglycerate mutase [Candidatus Syntrophocurvum alkaliphilum]|uniref:2,3-bisphosphoglycerate-independent phosphoglycerate mutase n=1 Tax=Candidatus Syntrophocurvum alkaliphilum TaxID=2293317 RepID=A0A6I6DHB9_9FIRM|nr:2,3-bisphosphoglycerate-independent phosphoglycerate mutase [Candidatus Syntrophocurvum alkaliphilum]QGU00354.1 2,3-bisphosphoglycerate-independent phosphoglycerate mutase [Candidatus Syntrophocurvum alkaliphilum]